MSDWDWFDEYEWAAQLNQDTERIPLGLLHRQAYLFRESDPDQALALLDQGRALAQKLHEPWWILYYDQQRVHALLHFKQDFRLVLDLAVRNALEVRKPPYARFPRRLLIHGDLVSAYLGIDPLGHADAIAQALAYLDGETPPDSDDRYLLLGSQRQFALERGAFDEAEAFCRRSLELAAADLDRGRAAHFLVFTWSGLCEVAWHRRDTAALSDAATTGEELARHVGHQVELAGFFIWQALVHRLEGRPDRGDQLLHRGSRRLAGLGMPPDASIRDAEAAYHELAGQLERALAVRDLELQQLHDRGRIAREAACLLARLSLLRRLDRLTPTDIDRTRQAISRLRRPDSAFARLDRLLRE